MDFPPGKALWSTVTKLYPNGTYSTYDGLGTYFKKNLDGSVSRDNWYLPAGTVPGQFDDAD